ncbi:MAG: SpoIIE family protein phosphatase [Bacteroidia bacterium]|nr:SpoIIE family protein phosphatase [Bacteroidia bacterium]MCZ2248034.1 SpoIIE family protein phosphatase [Bacteroidia bacterium]
MNRLFIILFFTLIIPQTVCGQGNSLLRQFLPKEYGGLDQNWSIVQDNDGLIYIGNNMGLLIYDGVKWQSLKINKSAVRSLDKSNNNVIYYGAQGDFGYLVANSNGTLGFKSLVNLLPDSLKQFGDVWKTYCLNNKVIFQTYDYLFVYENQKLSVIESENLFHFGYKNGNEFFIIDRGIGLKKLVGNSLELLNRGDFFANLRIYGWINQKNYSLIATRESGIFKISLSNDGIENIERFETEIDKNLKEGEVYCAKLLNNGNMAFGTLYQGLFITDSNGKLLQVIDKLTGLKSEMINDFYEDYQEGLWLALDIGIARVEANSGFKFINEVDGLEGIVTSVVNFNDYLYCSTNKGLFKISKNKVQKVENFNQDIRQLLVVGEDKSASLLILTESGTYKLSQSGQILQLNKEDGRYILPSKFYSGYYYLGTKSGLCVLNLNENHLKKYDEQDIFEVRRIVEENDSIIWIGTAYNGVYRIANAINGKYRTKLYSTDNGLPTELYNLPFEVNQKILFGTFRGIYEYNKSSDRFELSNNLAPNNYTQNDQIYQIIEGYDNNIWLFRTNEELHEFILFNTKTGSAKFPLRRLAEYDIYQTIYVESKSITWFGGTDGLFRYDASISDVGSMNFKTKIRGVYSGNDTLFGGYFEGDETNEEVRAKLNYNLNNINFDFVGLSFDNDKENVYSYYLEGFDNSWSNWTSESKKSYTNLYEGTYTFHVKSKNIYGKEGAEDVYEFVILPPWYRTGWAYLLYTIGIILLIYLITQISVRRLKRAKIKLEAIVESRTAEVVAEKEEVEKQKKIIELKNKDITDSINYAQKIQQAILPLPEDFSKVFPNSFIYFQPRDIVSGDFYWFYKPIKSEFNHVYFAMADCTGHGVPGAFMSMIGNTLLNEILNEKQIYNTDEILNHLHKEVREVLKQNIAQNTTNDGMDIALCRLNLDTFELQYSGANRPLYIFKHLPNQIEFFDIKPNKFPIGGYQNEEARNFNAHLIQLSKNDTFYIFSDGYADQFGGELNKKFMVRRLQKELMAMQTKPMSTQRQLVEKLIMDWKGSREQVDDILMIGVRL